MKIAIIEDEQLHMELLMGYIQSWGIQKKVVVEIESFPNAESFLFHWEEVVDFEVLFIDIQMKEMNGMELAKYIRKKDKNIVIIFTTGIADFMEEGYEVEAMHYLLKPISREKVEQCMDRVKERKKEKQFILLHHMGELWKVDIEKINYVEARGHGCILGMTITEKGYYQEVEKKEEITVTESISELKNILAEYHFIPCHRSYLCRIEAIHQIDKKEIYFDDGSHIPVSRRMYGEVNQAFIKYFRKM